MDAIPNAWVYQVEGQPEVKHFMDSYHSTASRQRPLLVDILNCPHGCNIGTGALCTDSNGLPVSRAMHAAGQELEQNTAKEKKWFFRRGKQRNDYRDSLDLSDFVRTYDNKHIRSMPVKQRELEQAYSSLHKYSPSDRNTDCCSCGSDSCEEMATAIARGINHEGNCVEYHKSILQEQQDEVNNLLEEQNQMSMMLESSVKQIFDAMSQSSTKSAQTITETEQINNEISGVQSIAKQLNNLTETLHTQIENYVELGSQIVNISMQIKLISMNASVEAAHAKEHGRGFSVLAEEMERLSDQAQPMPMKLLQVMIEYYHCLKKCVDLAAI